MTLTVGSAPAHAPGVATEGAAASSWLRTVVSGPPRALRVTGLSGPAGYLHVDDGEVVALETAEGVRLPNAVALDPTGPGVVGLAPDASGRIGDGRLEIGSRTIAVRRWWDPRPRIGTPVLADLAARRAGVPDAPAEAHRAFGLVNPIMRLEDAAGRRDRGALPQVVGDLVGRGPGSTPAGDDVLAGLLAALRTFRLLADREIAAFADALGREVRRAAVRTTALSATLLRCADSGAVVAAAGRMLRALAGHGAVGAAAAEMDRLGHTSGRDLRTGMTIGVDVLLTGRGPL